MAVPAEVLKSITYSLQDVANHVSEGDCWIILKGKVGERSLEAFQISAHSTQVYDVSKFMSKHPGGEEVFISAKGRDAIDDFEGVGHSRSAMRLLGTFCIGRLEGAIVDTEEPEKPERSLFGRVLGSFW